MRDITQALSVGCSIYIGWHPGLWKGYRGYRCGSTPFRVHPLGGLIANAWRRGHSSHGRREMWQEGLLAREDVVPQNA
jgi:hypothetical protein